MDDFLPFPDTLKTKENENEKDNHPTPVTESDNEKLNEQTVSQNEQTISQNEHTSNQNDHKKADDAVKTDVITKHKDEHENKDKGSKEKKKNNVKKTKTATSHSRNKTKEPVKDIEIHERYFSNLDNIDTSDLDKVYDENDDEEGDAQASERSVGAANIDIKVDTDNKNYNSIGSELGTRQYSYGYSPSVPQRGDRMNINVHSQQMGDDWYDQYDGRRTWVPAGRSMNQGSGVFVGGNGPSSGGTGNIAAGGGSINMGIGGGRGSGLAVSRTGGASFGFGANLGGGLSAGIIGSGGIGGMSAGLSGMGSGTSGISAGLSGMGSGTTGISTGMSGMGAGLTGVGAGMGGMTTGISGGFSGGGIPPGLGGIGYTSTGYGTGGYSHYGSGSYGGSSSYGAEFGYNGAPSYGGGGATMGVGGPSSIGVNGGFGTNSGGGAIGVGLGGMGLGLGVGVGGGSEGSLGFGVGGSGISSAGVSSGGVSGGSSGGISLGGGLGLGGSFSLSGGGGFLGGVKPSYISWLENYKINKLKNMSGCLKKWLKVVGRSLDNSMQVFQQRRLQLENINRTGGDLDSESHEEEEDVSEKEAELEKKRELLANSATAKRIVGGHKVTITKYPYTASYGLICGAAILSNYWLLTAGHCGTNFNTVYTGSTFISRAKKHKIEKHIVHPRYKMNTTAFQFDFDYQLLKLQTPLVFSNTQKPIALGSEKDIVVGSTPVVTGWGSTYEEGPTSNHLMAVEVPILSEKACKGKAEGQYAKYISERMFCAGYTEGGRDTCQGDSGGPLVYNNRLIGVVSFGVGCAEPDMPGVYASVHKVKDWISAETGIIV